MRSRTSGKTSVLNNVLRKAPDISPRNRLLVIKNRTWIIHNNRSTLLECNNPFIYHEELGQSNCKAACFENLLQNSVRLSTHSLFSSCPYLYCLNMQFQLGADGCTVPTTSNLRPLPLQSSLDYACPEFRGMCKTTRLSYGPYLLRVRLH